MNIIVFMTAKDAGEARSIASALVEEKLAACVNILPSIESVYSWQGSICSDDEILLIAKTRQELFDRLEERVKDMHSYDVPEIIAVPIQHGSARYLDWINKNTLNSEEGE